MPRPIDPLLQAVFDDPRDDRLREVVADALMERGDPRGEFIALQLGLARGVLKHIDRAYALERRFGRDWAGLAPISRVRFARGFPWLVEAPTASDQPEWATVGVLVLPTGHTLAPFLASSRWLTSLERLMNIDTETLRGCSPSNLPSLRAVDLSHELELEALEHLTTFPDVTELSFSATAPFTNPALFRSDLLSTVQHLRLRAVLGEALDLSALAHALAPATQPLVSVETFLGVTFEFGRERVLQVSFLSQDLAVSLSDRALDTVRANVPSIFRQFEFIAAGKPANALVPDALHRWLR
ncbi:MAG: TIGR02996 domain-containing protein [Myxococcales bacterium]|nr:TIGR02996 domain-containing protein [Myxococcales bacterium]